MNKHFTPAISEEKFAAWLDGMLPADEMQKVSQMVESDGMLHQLQETNDLIEDTISDFNNSNFRLPSEIIDPSFVLPTVPINSISQLVSVLPEPMEELLIATCANEDSTMFENDNLFNSSLSSEFAQNELKDSSSGIEPFDNADDLSTIINDE